MNGSSGNGQSIETICVPFRKLISKYIEERLFKIAITENVPLNVYRFIILKSKILEL